MRFQLFALFSMLLATGCGGGNGTVKVEGTVKLNGAPLPNVTIMFHPVEQKNIADNGRAATGQTDAQGAFKLSSLGVEDGIVPGEYKIVVYAATVAPLDMKSDGAKRVQELKQANAVHPNYSNFGKTPLKRKIDGKGRVDIELKADGT